MNSEIGDFLFGGSLVVSLGGRQSVCCRIGNFLGLGSFVAECSGVFVPLSGFVLLLLVEEVIAIENLLWVFLVQLGLVNICARL